MKAPRWTKPQASALQLLKSGRRIRFTGERFIVADAADEREACAVIAGNTMLRLVRAGAVDLIRDDGQLYAVLVRKLPNAPPVRGKAAASGANLEDELA